MGTRGFTLIGLVEEVIGTGWDRSGCNCGVSSSGVVGGNRTLISALMTLPILAPTSGDISPFRTWSFASWISARIWLLDSSLSLRRIVSPSGKKFCTSLIGA